MNTFRRRNIEESDKKALERCKKNDEKGLKMLFDKYYDALCFFSLNYTNDLNVSKDLAQDVFIKFWDKASQGVIDSSVKSYLFISVKNASINYINKNNTYHRFLQKYLVRMEFSQESLESEEKETMRRKIDEAVNSLPAKSRKVFQLVVFEDMKYKEAADHLNISINTVKTQLRHAYSTLREKLDFLIIIPLIFFHSFSPYFNMILS